tara:strand:+ start:133 stop:333 length:201 start_codon:yes stop_codon:yes gene_type:complete
MPEKSRVTYGRTINLGNYNSERLECSMVIEDGEDPDEKMQACYEVVKKQAMDKHGDKIRDNQDLPL